MRQMIAKAPANWHHESMGFELEYLGIQYHIWIEEDPNFLPLDPKFQRLSGFNLKDITSGILKFCTLTYTAKFQGEEFVFVTFGNPLPIDAEEEELLDDLSDFLAANRTLDRLDEKVKSYFGKCLPSWKVDE